MVNGEAMKDRYMVLLYKNRPVSEQEKYDEQSLAVKFHDKPGVVEIIHENDWSRFQQKVFVPRSCGPRKDVVKNWNKYEKYASTDNGVFRHVQSEPRKPASQVPSR